MRRLPHSVRTVIGVILIILAIVTGPIPIVQGWMFFLAAVAVLGTDHVIVKWCYRQMERGKDWMQRFRLVRQCMRPLERAKEWLWSFMRKKDPEPKV